jgi:hypothetical protein
VSGRQTGRYPETGFWEVSTRREGAILDERSATLKLSRWPSSLFLRLPKVTVHALLSGFAKDGNSGLVFPSNRSVGHRFLDLKRGFKRALRLANIPEGLRWHDLRHTFASRLVGAGVDLITVSQLMGHSGIAMTVRYAHPLADAKMAAVSKLDSVGFCSVPDSNRTPGPSGSLPNPREIVLLHEYRPAAQLVRALP